MSGASFTWIPDFAAKMTHKPNVRVARFGDGYEQRVQFGINADLQVWDVTFRDRSDAEAGAIDAFLATAGALQSFAWQPPGAAAVLKFVCRQWSKSPTHGQGTQGAPAFLWTITGKFEQVAEP